MLTKHRVYQGFMQLFIVFLPNADLVVRKRLSAFLFAIFVSQSVVIRRMAAALDSIQDSGLQESHDRALRRTLDDSRLSWHDIYAPLFKKVVSFTPDCQGNITTYLVIDETTRKGRFRVLTAAIVCNGRCIPVAWVVWRGWQKKRTGFFWNQFERLLSQASKVLDPAAHVIVIGDRAFGTPQFTDLVEEKGYDWVVRLQGQTCFARQDGQVQIVDILERPGFYKAKGCLFKKSGWREAILTCYWKKSYRDALLLGSSLPWKWNVVKIYKKRALIENLFRDWKSKGFQWEESWVDGLQRAKRQVLLMAIATVLALCLGQKKAAEVKQRKTNTRRTIPYEAKESIFQMGLRDMQGYLLQTRTFPKSWSLEVSSEPQNWSNEISSLRAKSGRMST